MEVMNKKICMELRALYLAHISIILLDAFKNALLYASLENHDV